MVLLFMCTWNMDYSLSNYDRYIIYNAVYFLLYAWTLIRTVELFGSVSNPLFEYGNGRCGFCKCMTCNYSAELLQPFYDINKDEKSTIVFYLLFLIERMKIRLL